MGAAALGCTHLMITTLPASAAKGLTYLDRRSKQLRAAGNTGKSSARALMAMTNRTASSRKTKPSPSVVSMIVEVPSTARPVAVAPHSHDEFTLLRRAAGQRQQ